jgi:hypothetical protein
MRRLLTRGVLVTTLALAAIRSGGAYARSQTEPACTVPPPANLTYTVDDHQVTLAWQAVPGTLPTRYSVEMGNASGSTYLGTTDTELGQTSFTKTLATGVYFVRVRASNSCGLSAPSGEVRVPVDPAHIGPTTPPDVVVAHRTAARNTYFPTAELMKSGEIVVVYYDSPDHVSRNGRISMVRSADSGRSWSTPAVVVDGPNDERDPNIVETAAGTWLVSYFESDTMKAPASQGVFVIRSTDRGRTWSAPTKVATTLAGTGTSAKIVQLENGELLIPIYGGPNGAPDAAAGIVRSSDDGRSWPPSGEVILAARAGVHFVEPALVSLGGGRLLAMIRTEGAERAGYETWSTDGGKSWAPAAKSTLVAQASDLLAIRQGDAQLIVHAWGDMSGRFGDSRPTVLQVTRFREFPQKRWNGEVRLLHQGHCWADEGYPSSVQLRDGRIFTVYYDACAGYIGGSFSTISDPSAAAECSEPPAAVELKMAGKTSDTVSLAWTPSGSAHTSFMVEAGTAPGAADALARDVGGDMTFNATGVSPGTYYVRVRATNACGSSAPSNELTVVVP